jgi:hypothetical protein
MRGDRDVFGSSPGDAQRALELVTDPVDGHPVRIEIDWTESAIDDDECYEILRYEPLAPWSSPTTDR